MGVKEGISSHEIRYILLFLYRGVITEEIFPIPSVHQTVNGYLQSLDVSGEGSSSLGWIGQTVGESG